MIIAFSRTKNDPQYVKKYGPIAITTQDPCKHEIVDTKRGRMLKVEIGKKNGYDPILSRAFGISCTSEWMYIPMEYVLEIKEGVSTEDYFKRGF